MTYKIQRDGDYKTLCTEYTCDASTPSSHHLQHRAFGRVSSLRYAWKKIRLQSTDGTLLHVAKFNSAGYFDAT